MDHISADGKRRFILFEHDGVSTVPTPRKKDPRHTFAKSYAPGKVAGESEIRKSKARPLPSDYEYDPGKHMPRSNAAASTLRTSNATEPTVHVVGNEPIAQFRHGDVCHFVHGETLHHGRVAGLSKTHALCQTPERPFTVPLALLHPGRHPDAEQKGKTK